MQRRQSILGINDVSHQGKVKLDKAFESAIPRPPLNRWVQKYWQLNILGAGYTYRAIPDNHVDCIFEVNSQEAAFVVPPFCEPQHFKFEKPATYFGIRLRVLAQHSFTQIPLADWYNASFSEIFGLQLAKQLTETIDANRTFEQRCQQVGNVLSRYITQTTIDRRLLRFVHYAFNNSHSELKLGDDYCAEFGLSSRQLRRLCHLYLGVSPRNFYRVLRFQRALDALNQGHHKDLLAGYYDQAHYIREFKTFAGVTPGNFLKTSVLYNTDVSTH